MRNAISKMKFLSAAALAVGSLVLSSCGGGSGVPNPPGGNGVAPGTTDVTGQLIQGSDVKASATVGQGLPGILVALVQSAGGQQLGSDVTDANGYYEFKGVPSGSGYVIKVEFNSSQDLDGDGSPDQVELNFPVDLADQSVTQLLQRIGVGDSDDDGQLDAVEVEFHFSDDKGHVEDHHSEHRHRSGETLIDDDGDGEFEDSFDDNDADGISDDDDDDDAGDDNGGDDIGDDNGDDNGGDNGGDDVGDDNGDDNGGDDNGGGDDTGDDTGDDNGGDDSGDDGGSDD